MITFEPKDADVNELCVNGDDIVAIGRDSENRPVVFLVGGLKFVAFDKTYEGLVEEWQQELNPFAHFPTFDMPEPWDAEDEDDDE